MLEAETKKMDIYKSRNAGRAKGINLTNEHKSGNERAPTEDTLKRKSATPEAAVT